MAADNPRCRVCGKPAAWREPVKIGNMDMPGFFAAHCGSEACSVALYEARPMAAPERPADPAEQHARRCLAIGVQSEYQAASLRDFPGVELPTDGRSVLIRGLNGRGKTRLACALLLEAANRGRKCHFTTATMFLKRVRSSYSRRATETEMDVLEHLLSYDELCLDDLGAEKQGDFGLSEILNLLSERSVRGLRNIVTTNLRLVEIHKAEPRLASRLAAYADIDLEGLDRRASR